LGKEARRAFDVADAELHALQFDRHGAYYGSHRGGPMLMHRQSRRAFLRAAAALGTLPLVPQASAQEKRKLPARGEYLIRGAHVMTMDAATGDIAGGDVHVRNGEIVAIGKSLKAPRAPLLDGRGMIVLPGLVETHWH